MVGDPRLEALKMVIARRKPGSGVIHHSDRRVRYASGDYVGELKGHGFEISTVKIETHYENARMG